MPGVRGGTTSRLACSDTCESRQTCKDCSTSYDCTGTTCYWCQGRGCANPDKYYDPNTCSSDAMKCSAPPPPPPPTNYPAPDPTPPPVVPPTPTPTMLPSLYPTTSLPTADPTADHSPAPTGTVLSQKDGAALCELYSQQSSTVKSNALASWGCTGPGPYNPCITTQGAWYGVTCGLLSGASRVVSLRLNSMTIAGSIPSSIGNLDALSSLDLDTNNLSQSIPSALGALINLQELYLYSNKFTRGVPTAIGNLSALTCLELSANSLSSSIPSQVGMLTNLQKLSLAGNYFTGTIPTTFGNMAAMTSLNLNENSLSRSLPLGLGSLSMLQILWLRGNRFTSAVPLSFCQLNHSVQLDITSNAGLSCLPSCLTNPPYVQLNSDINVFCGTNPTPTPATTASSGALPLSVATMAGVGISALVALVLAVVAWRYYLHRCRDKVFLSDTKQVVVTNPITNSRGSSGNNDLGTPAIEIPWDQLIPESRKSDDKKLEGGSSIVFKANYKRKLVAVKIFRIRRGKIDCQSAEKMLRQEAETLKRAGTGTRNTNVDYIVHCYGIAIGNPTEQWRTTIKSHASELLGTNEAGKQYLMALVLRFEEGGTLHDLIHPKVSVCTLSTVERLRILGEICEGLHSLHESGQGDSITHGDLKPGNILLSDKVQGSMKVRLADFGLSRTRDVGAGHSKSVVSTHPDAGGAVGTCFYMAPELEIRNASGALASISRTTDIYSLGTLMWEVLSGGKGKPCLSPWISEGADDFDQMKLDRRDAIKQGMSLPCEVPDVFPLDVSKDVINMIQRCLSFEMDANQRALEQQRQRPKIGEVLKVIEVARNEMLKGHYDVFLSYNWGPKIGMVHKRQELMKEVYKELTKADYMVWLDCADNMGTWMEDCMREGIRNCSCMVLFLSPEYCTSNNCLKELKFADEQGKPIIVCMTEKDFWTKWNQASGPLLDPNGYIVKKLDLVKKMFCDFKEAYEVDWTKNNISLSFEKKRVFYDCSTAMPELLRQMRELPGVGPGLKARDASGGGEGDGGAAGLKFYSAHSSPGFESFEPSALTRQSLFSLLSLVPAEPDRRLSEGASAPKEA